MRPTPKQQRHIISILDVIKKYTCRGARVTVGVGLVWGPNRYLRTHAIYTSLRLKARDFNHPRRGH